MVTTTGNNDSHLILRGGDDGPNHDAASVAAALAALEKNGLAPMLMVDASHANCAKDCRQMPDVFREIIRQRADTRGIIGAMLESNLVAGAQSLKGSRDSLVYGQSITDQCMDWDTTEALLREAAKALEGH
jgi:3-deoxy-7-phosphoheptulonate synthase